MLPFFIIWTSYCLNSYHWYFWLNLIAFMYILKSNVTKNFKIAYVEIQENFSMYNNILSICEAVRTLRNIYL